MTSVENERLAVVEVEVKNLTASVVDVRETVKGFDGKLDGVLQYIAGETAAKAERRRESEFRRWLAPIVVTLINVVIGAASLIVRMLPAH